MRIVERARGLVHGRAAVLSAVWAHPLNRGSRLAAVRDYFIWNAARFAMDAKHVLALTDDVEIIVGRKENYASSIYVHNLSDFHEMMFLAHLMTPGTLFLDVGANAGLYSVWVAGVTGADAIAIEPVPATFRLLQRNVRLNDLGRLITAHQVAAGSEAGFVSMTTDEGGLDHVVLDREAGASVRVPVERLDTLVAGRVPLALKIDVEGFEMSVLKGAEAVLADNSLVAVVIELQDWTLHKYATSEEQICRYLASFGFQPHRYDPSNRQLTPTERCGRLNEIFVRFSDDVAARLKAAKRVRTPLMPNGL